MKVLAEFVIPTESVPGGRTLLALPEASIRLERIVPDESVLHPIFWLSGVEVAAFLEAVSAEPNIDDVQELIRLHGDVLFRATWTADDPVIEGIKALRATIVSAVGTAERWVFQVVAADRSGLRAFQQLFQARGIPVELRRLSDVARTDAAESGLTAKQREALVTAYRRGYYDRPRQVTQSELGDELGISGRAVSKRLNRGTKQLIERALVDRLSRGRSEDSC